MTEQIEDFGVEFAREQELSVQLQMAEYAILIEAIVLATRSDIPGLDRIRELSATRSRLLEQHTAQMRRTTAAMQAQRLDTIGMETEGVLDVH